MTNITGMDRRALLQRAMILAGAAALPGGSEAIAAAVKSGKGALDPAHFALLSAVADTIVPKTDTPGAVDVGVPKQLDAILAAWATPQHRAEMIGALDTIDRLAQQKHQRGFAKLTPEERLAVLAPHDADALKAAPPPPKPAAAAVPVGGAATTVDPQVGRAKQEPTQTSIAKLMAPRFADPGYGKLKELIVVLYYYSEPALTSELAYEHNPGVWEPSMPITPATRPWGGNSLI